MITEKEIQEIQELLEKLSKHHVILEVNDTPASWAGSVVFADGILLTSKTAEKLLEENEQMSITSGETNLH